MNIIPGDVIIEPPRTPPQGKSQPIQTIDVPAASPDLDDSKVRQAIALAEANNIDPQSVTMDDLAKGIVNTSQAKPSVEVPEKFLKPDGTVDVDKLQTSTQALDAAIQKKEEALSKTVDDYMREYQERERKFHDLKIPQKPQAAPQPAISQEPLAENDPEAIVRRDYAIDPLGTTTRLLELMLQQKFQPIEQREKAEATRSNLQALAAKDPRILREDVFAKVNEKLQNDPDLWRLKNPHKAAWLEVKEELRLGDAPTGAPAQPSRLSPVLGGGTPPSVPSAQVPSPVATFASLDALDLRDKKQEAIGDEAIRRALMGNLG